MEEATRNAAILYVHAMDRYEGMTVERVLPKNSPTVRAMKEAAANFERAIAAERLDAVSYMQSEKLRQHAKRELHEETNIAAHDRFVAAQEEWNGKRA